MITALSDATAYFDGHAARHLTSGKKSAPFARRRRLRQSYGASLTHLNRLIPRAALKERQTESHSPIGM